MRDFALIPIKPLFELLSDYNKNKPKNKQIWLDANDMVIFDYIAQFCLSDNEKIKQNRIVVDGVEYTHIAYKNIIEDNPILPFESKRNLIRSLEKLEYIDLIRKQVYKKNGNKTYFTLGQFSQYLLTNLSIGYRQKSDNPLDKNVNSLSTNLSHNRNINIDTNNRNKKIEKKDSPIYIGSLSFFEKKFLRVIFNLRDLFENNNLPAYKEKKYFETYKQLIRQGYKEEDILTAIYARVYKAHYDNVDLDKYLETLSNPNYFKKSIDQLIMEINYNVQNIIDLYSISKEEAINEYLPNLFIRYCYNEYNDYIHYLDIIKFEDKIEKLYYLEDIEYHIYLITKFLAKYELHLFDGFRSSILKNAKENIAYDNLIKRILYSLIYFEDNEDYDLLEDYTALPRMVELFNDRLATLEIDLSLEEIIQELEKRNPLN
ncbi:hypothetical protein JCM11957_10630 [Caminibacter profundus]